MRIDLMIMPDGRQFIVSPEWPGKRELVRMDGVGSMLSAIQRFEKKYPAVAKETLK